MMFMHEIEIPKGVEVTVKDGKITVKGKLGSTTKTVNGRLMIVRIEQNKVVILESENKKFAKKSALATKAFSTEISSAINGVQNGIEQKMDVFYAHFPMTIEVKGNKVHVKNIFGERVPRVTGIVGSTKVEVKGQNVTVKGVDPYDVGQTVANIKSICYARGYDTRVFQDGVYPSKEE
jgi:large subunit ribosomal protein L6